MPDYLSVEESLKSDANPKAPCRMNYEENIISVFKRETNEQGYRLPKVNKKTGITIEKREIAPDKLMLKVRHQKDLGLKHILKGDLKVERNDWRSPIEWNFTQYFQGKTALNSFSEKGSWDQKHAKLVSTGSGAEVIREQSVASLTSLYSLIADFPTEVEFYPGSQETSILEDTSTINHGAKLQPAPKNISEHSMAKGLKGYVLDYPANFPVEFWTNKQGAVIYLCFGPNRALSLKSIEAL